MKKIIIALILFLIFQSPFNAYSKSQFSGQITYNNIKMTIIDAVAVWDTSKNSLNIWFAPVEFSDEDLENAKSGDGWMIRLGEKHGRIDIRLYEGDVNLSSVNWCDFIFHSLTKKNYTSKFNRHGPEIQESFQNLEINKNELILQTKSSAELSGVKYEWDINVTCPLFKI